MTYEVVYFDESMGDTDAIIVEAYDKYDAIERVEKMGEFEVISCDLLTD